MSKFLIRIVFLFLAIVFSVLLGIVVGYLIWVPMGYEEVAITYLFILMILAAILACIRVFSLPSSEL